MRLTVVSPPASIPQEQALLRRMLDADPHFTYHLRKPGHSAAQVADYLSALPAHHRARTVVHEHHSLAAVWSLRGIHLRERDRQALRASSSGGSVRRQPGLTLSTSIHADSADELPTCSDFDYVWLSPIFDSISKESYGCAFPDRRQLRALVASCPCPVYALGGVTPDRFEELASLGFAGAVMLGGIWEADDPVAALAAAASACKQLER